MHKYLYETHLHTCPVSACAEALPEEQARAYKAREYAGIIVTDHFFNGNCSCPRSLPWAEKVKYFASGYEAAKEEGERCGLDVFFGWEYNLRGTEFLTYGLTIEFLLEHPDVDKLTVAEYSALVRKSGGYLAQAHPFREGGWIANPYPVDPTLMDGIEAFNASIPYEANLKARDFAVKNNLPMQAGSDSHTQYLRTGKVSGVMLEKKAESVFDIIEAIKSGRAEMIV